MVLEDVRRMVGMIDEMRDDRSEPESNDVTVIACTLEQEVERVVTKCGEATKREFPSRSRSLRLHGAARHSGRTFQMG
jgi:hypothetical protein